MGIFDKKDMIFADYRILNDSKLTLEERAILITLIALEEGKLSEGKDIYNCSSDSGEEVNLWLKSLEEKGYITIRNYELEDEVYVVFCVKNLDDIYG